MWVQENLSQIWQRSQRSQSVISIVLHKFNNAYSFGLNRHYYVLWASWLYYTSTRHDWLCEKVIWGAYSGAWEAQYCLQNCSIIITCVLWASGHTKFFKIFLNGIFGHSWHLYNSLHKSAGSWCPLRLQFLGVRFLFSTQGSRFLSFIPLPSIFAYHMFSSLNIYYYRINNKEIQLIKSVTRRWIVSGYNTSIIVPWWFWN